MTELKKPEYTPEQIEKMLADYRLLEEAADAAEAKRATEENRLIPIVKKHGDKAAKAVQSFLLQGLSHAALATFGFTHTTDQDAIKLLLGYMKEQKLLRYFRRLFLPKLTFTKIGDAAQVLMDAKLEEAQLKTIYGLFGSCAKSSPQKPKLKVSIIKPIPVKKPRKAKAGKVAA